MSTDTTFGPLRQATRTHSSTGATDLLAAAHDGDSSAWEELVRRYERVVWVAVRAFRLRDADAHDAVQMTWLRLLENADRVRDPERLHGWLSTTATRECLRLLRQDRLVVVDDEQLGRLADPLPGPEEQAVTAVVREQVWEAVADLPPRARLLVRALFAESRAPYTEVAAATGLAIGSLGPTRARALTRVRSLLERKGFGAADL